LPLTTHHTISPAGTLVALRRTDAIRPSDNCTTRSAMPAIAALCVMTAVVVPSSRLTRSTASSTTMPVCTSSAPVGSSHNKTSGRLAIARAIATRCCSPPESCEGKWSARASRPTSGEVWYHDQDITHAGDAELTAYRRRHVGFVFQFYNLIPSLTALENVALVTDIAESPMPALEALAMVRLDDRRDHFPAQLSGGEQQRVAIARAIAKLPSVLLCDEPTGALDISTGVVVLDALARINAELGTTTVVITHNAAIAGMADRVIRLADGRIASIDVNTQRRLAPRELSW